MIRTQIFPCQLSKTEADTLNCESGRLYTQTMVWHYRTYRHTGHWLSQYGAQRFGDSLSGTTLHAHSRDAAQQAFYNACKITKINRGHGAKYPHKQHYYRTTIWKNTGIRLKGNQLLLARARGLNPLAVQLPGFLTGFPQKSFLEMRLVYDHASRKYSWHVVIENGTLPSVAPGDKTLAIDLGEIHPMAVANEQGKVLIVTARALRSLNQYRNKQQASLDSRLSKCTKGSRLYKRLKQRKCFMLVRNKCQRRDIEHKVTKAVTMYAVQQKASRVVVGDVRDIGNSKRLNKNSNQKIGDWSHGKQINYLIYKLAAEGIDLEQQNESWSTKTCCQCGMINKPSGRTYKCSVCGFVGHRDGSAACNQESKALFGVYSKIQPIDTMYLRPFRKGRSRSVGHAGYSLETQ